MICRKCIFRRLYLVSTIAIVASISNASSEGMSTVRNELNQIYWRIQANNRINDPELEEEHEWIKQDRYWESIVKVIGKAIGDCVTGQGVFANKKAGDVITFEGTNPERYERRHWNAVLLYNCVHTLIKKDPKSYNTTASASEISATMLKQIINAVFPSAQNQPKATLCGTLYAAIEDIERYDKVLNLTKLLNEYRKNCEKYKNANNTEKGEYIAPHCIKQSDGSAIFDIGINYIQDQKKSMLELKPCFLRNNDKLYVYKIENPNPTKREFYWIYQDDDKNDKKQNPYKTYIENLFNGLVKIYDPKEIDPEEIKRSNQIKVTKII